MKITTMPKETLAELLLFISENERFSSVEGKLAGGVSVEEVRASLRELSRELTREASEEQSLSFESVRKSAHLSPKSRKIISYLSPHEEKTLFTAFGLDE